MTSSAPSALPLANFAAGRAVSDHGISFDMIEAVWQETKGRVRTLIEKLVGCGDPSCS